MKAIFTYGVLILLLAIAGCGGNSNNVHLGSPIGPFLFMVGPSSDNLFSFKGSDSGAISPIASAATGNAPSAIVMESLSTFQINLFVADSAGNNLTVFNLDPTSGVATAAGISVPVGANPIAIALRGPSGIASANTPPDMGALYVLNQGSNSISAFKITDASGHLSPAPGSPFATQANPQAIAVLTSGASPSNVSPFVYVANGALGTISGFKINTDGSLTELAGSPFAASGTVSGLAGRFGGTVLLASDSANNKVVGFQVQADGTLTPLPGATAATGSQPGALTFSLNDFVYVPNRGSNNVSAYKFDSTSSTLTPVAGSPFAAGTTPVALGTARPLQLYVANQGSSDISGFNVDSATGALTPMPGSPFHTPAPPNSIQTLFVKNVD